MYVLLALTMLGNNIVAEQSDKVSFPFHNVSLPWAVRVDDLVARVTVAEAILQLARGGRGPNAGPAPPIPRLGVNPFQWDTECLHGVAQAGNATAFPQAIGLAASFDTGLMYAVARAIGREARAKNNYAVAHGDYSTHTGINCFSPVVNIARHPLWGRVQETYGEDPHLTGKLAEYFVKGLQGNDSRYIMATATCKHAAAYSGPENIPDYRFFFNAKVTEKDLHITYLPAFRDCVNAGAYSIMCSYNSINGIPTCADGHILTDILRKAWKFTGFAVSDEGALENIIWGHQYVKTFTEVAAIALKAGINLNLSSNMKYNAYTFLTDCVAMGLVNETLIRDRLRPLVYTRMRLGDFDPTSMNPYTKLAMKDYVQSPEHIQLAVDAAVKSFVMLKNVDGFLPLSENVSSIGLIGPVAYAMKHLYGDYAADRMPQFEYGILSQLRAAVTKMSATRGCTDGPWCRKYNATAVLNVLQSKPDTVILTLGTTDLVEYETRDRESLALPNEQARLLAEVVAQTSAPIVLLIFSATPVDIRLAEVSSQVKAILWCGFPAQATGMAVRYAVFQNRKLSSAIIGGRLPFTWYASEEQLPGRTDYLMHNQTYRYIDAVKNPPLYPFGYGLSFSEFRYESFKVTSTFPIRLGQSVQFKVQLRNVGKFVADEVIQLYGTWLNVSGMPQVQLMGFRRITLTPNKSIVVDLIVGSGQYAVWIDGKGITLTPVRMMFYVGGQLPNQKKQSQSNILKLTVQIGK